MAFLTIITVILTAFSMQTILVYSNFDAYYFPLWGQNHFSINPKGTHAQLLFDQSSGAGFRSKLEYGSGLFHIRMKLPDRKTGGIVTCFYLTSAPDYQDPGNHFEIDYEFLGTNGTVQTNVYDNDGGHREQSFTLWFDPTADFHTYEFLWNSKQIVFFIDKIPVRVFKNNMAQGIAYPTKPMHIEASLWNADWAGAVDWSQAPFVAHYKSFDFYACPAQDENDVALRCSTPKLYWNRERYLDLSPEQMENMETYRRLYMTYDYCTKESTRKPECDLI